MGPQQVLLLRVGWTWQWRSTTDHRWVFVLYRVTAGAFYSLNRLGCHFRFLFFNFQMSTLKWRSRQWNLAPNTFLSFPLLGIFFFLFFGNIFAKQLFFFRIKNQHVNKIFLSIDLRDNISFFFFVFLFWRNKLFVCLFNCLFNIEK